MLFYLFSILTMLFLIPDKIKVDFEGHAFTTEWNVILTCLLINRNILLLLFFH